jgi:hypothetical protein
MLATTIKPISLNRPLVSVWTVLSVTDFKTEDEVLAAIADGRLLWAFNIAGKKAKRALVRVLAVSVYNFVEGRLPPTISEDEQWKQVQRMIFPTPGLASIPAKDVAIAWNASGTHILNLCDQGLLRLAKGTHYHSGRGGSPQVEYQSAVQFLRARRIF